MRGSGACAGGTERTSTRAGSAIRQDSARGVSHWRLHRRRGWCVEQRATDGDDAIPDIFEAHTYKEEPLERARSHHIGPKRCFHGMLEREEELVQLAVLGDEPACD